jgi:hypothetical protein
MKWFGRVIDILAAITLTLAGLGGIYTTITGLFGLENILPASKNPTLFTMGLVGILSLGIGLERLGRFRKIEEQIEKLTKLPDAVRANIQGSFHLVYQDRNLLYTEAQRLLEIASSTEGYKDIRLAALHGFREQMSTIPPDRRVKPSLNQFDRAMEKCIQSPLCLVREIHIITTEDRLNMVVNRLRKYERVEGYEVRAFSISHALAYLSPLIVGEDDAVLGIEDPQYYRVEKAIHLKGKDSVRIVIEYFDSLWNDKRLIELKTPLRIKTENIDCFRAKFKNRRQLT